MNVDEDIKISVEEGQVLLTLIKQAVLNFSRREDNHMKGFRGSMATKF